MTDAQHEQQTPTIQLAAPPTAQEVATSVLQAVHDNQVSFAQTTQTQVHNLVHQLHSNNQQQVAQIMAAMNEHNLNLARVLTQANSAAPSRPMAAPPTAPPPHPWGPQGAAAAATAGAWMHAAQAGGEHAPPAEQAPTAQQGAQPQQGAPQPQQPQQGRWHWDNWANAKPNNWDDKD